MIFLVKEHGFLELGCLSLSHRCLRRPHQGSQLISMGHRGLHPSWPARVLLPFEKAFPLLGSLPVKFHGIPRLLTPCRASLEMSDILSSQICMHTCVWASALVRLPWQKEKGRGRCPRILTTKRSPKPMAPSDSVEAGAVLYQTHEQHGPESQLPNSHVLCPRDWRGSPVPPLAFRIYPAGWFCATDKGSRT